MSTNPLVELTRLGQSIWYDNIERRLITSGELKRMIDEDDLRGVTSNPAIFEKAISSSDEYVSQIAELAAQEKGALEIYEALAIRDIQGATDLFAPVFEKTKGLDGYVSLECSPFLANDTAGTIEEARRLWRAVDRKNVMIKIPGTPAGMPAIEQCIYEGININVTLLFSLESYERTIDAYLNGLNRRLSEGKPIEHIASVASFFVSRIDTAVDKRLEELIARAEDKETKARLQSLLGRVAIANAKLAYRIYKSVFHGERFAALKAAGAMVQRPLWASTSVKNPAYGDVYYVEALIGPETINTLPPATFVAFRDHGRVRITIEDNLEEEQAILERLEAVEIRLADVTTKVLEDGVRLFVEPFEKLLAAIEKRRAELLGQQGASQATQK
ncbi:MAG TPA: transaldolase [Blastocatellia bacterium]|nr:transaldolase [Blastocatellia bacterium]